MTPHEFGTALLLLGLFNAALWWWEERGESRYYKAQAERYRDLYHGKMLKE